MCVIQYYIRIGNYIRKQTSATTRTVRYTVTVITRDGATWELTKSLGDFYSFWAHLPFGMGLHSKLHLKTGFPLWKLNTLSLKTMVMGSFRSEMTDEEVRRRACLLTSATVIMYCHVIMLCHALLVAASLLLILHC